MEKSFPFNSVNGDRRYKAEDWRDNFATLIGNGVFPNPSTGLQVISNNNMTITIREGKGWINGAIYHNTDNLVLAVDHADGTLNRIDRVILRFDNLERNITCRVKKGVFSSNPTVPGLQRDADAYELCIAEIKVDRGITSIVQSKITDTRLNSELCGIVAQTVKEIDTTTLFAKLEAYIDERGQDVEGWIQESTAKWEIDFVEWFNTIKDVLDGDVAGALANRILALEDKVGSGLTASNVMMEDGKSVQINVVELQGELIELQKELNGQRTKAIGLHNRLDKVF